MITILSEAYDLTDKFKDFPTALLIPYTNIHYIVCISFGRIRWGSSLLSLRTLDPPSEKFSAHMPAKLPTSPKTPQK